MQVDLSSEEVQAAYRALLDRYSLTSDATTFAALVKVRRALVKSKE